MPQEHIRRYNEWKATAPEYSKMTRSEKRAKMLEFKRDYLSESSAQRNIARAKEMYSSDPAALSSLEALERGPEAFQREIQSQAIESTPYADRYVSRITGAPRSETEARMLEATYPNIAKNLDNISPVSGIADLASLPGRAYESATYKLAGGEMPFSERMAQTDGTGLISEAIRSPYALQPTSGIGTGLAAAAKPLAQRAIGYAGKWAIEQIPSAAMEQLRKIEEGRDVDASEFVTEVAAGGFLPVAAKTIGKAAKPTKEFLKDIMSEASGRSKELLEMVGNRELKEWARKSTLGEKAKPDEVLEKLRNYTDNAEQIADEVIKTVDNFDVIYRENNDVIEKAINSMPEMDTQPLIRELENSKMLLPPGNKKGFEGEIAFNNQVDKLVNRIKGKVRERYKDVSIFDMPSSMEGPLTKISASDMLDIRRDIDRTINWDAETFSKDFYSPIQKFKKEARAYIKDNLERQAAKIGNKQYSKVMKDYSNQLDLQDDVKRALLPRVNDLGQTDRVNNFLLRMGNPNKIDAKKFAAKFKRLLGRDLFEDANFLRLSKEYRDALPIANDIKTGRKNWLQGFVGTTGGKLATFPISSPKTAAPLTAGINAIGRDAEMYGPLMGNLIRAGKTEYIGE